MLSITRAPVVLIRSSVDLLVVATWRHKREAMGENGAESTSTPSPQHVSVGGIKVLFKVCEDTWGACVQMMPVLTKMLTGGAVDG